MICEDTELTGEIEVGGESIILAQTMLHATSAETKVVLGERNIVEERVQIIDSTLGHANLVECGSTITNSHIGNFSYISPKCRLQGCTIGDCCIIGTGVVLDGVTIADNTSVWRCGAEEDEWTSASADITLKYQYHDALWLALSSPSSQQYIGKHFKLRS